MLCLRSLDLAHCPSTAKQALPTHQTSLAYLPVQRKHLPRTRASTTQVVLEEARDSYAPEIVHEVPSATQADLRQNVERVVQWRQMWTADQAAGAAGGAGAKGRKRRREG
jgi:hypothetical protein